MAVVHVVFPFRKHYYSGPYFQGLGGWGGGEGRGLCGIETDVFTISHSR